MMPSRTQHQGGTDSGGFYALVGYTQQMLGSAAQFVRFLGTPTPPGSTDWEAIHSFEVEAEGQDTKMAGSRVVLTQFKVSTDPENHPIGPKALQEIAESFLKSEKRLRKFSLTPVERVLRSNRPLGSSARPERHEIRYERYDPLAARREVEAYAKQFGICEPAELELSLRRIVGDLVSIGAEIGSHRITRA